jgi:hypothetical protein
MEASANQGFRGFGAVIVYRGHTLWRRPPEPADRRALWVVFSAKPADVAGDPCGDARTFEAARAFVDQRIAALKSAPLGRAGKVQR